jgi:hypothetical protein
MNSNYHLTDATRQSYTSGAGSGISFSAQLVAARSNKSLRIPQTTVAAHPVLVGDRETLRKLRAAEMLAWESVNPKTPLEQTGSEPKPQKLWRLASSRTRSGESLSFLVLAVCAGAASFVGLGDMSELVSRWSLFVQGIRNLLE